VVVEAEDHNLFMEVELGELVDTEHQLELLVEEEVLNLV
jgi:hypothetical protein